jgi:hypothetical protein
MTNQSLSSGLLCHLTIMLLDKVNSAYGTRSIGRAPDQFQGALILPDTHRGIFKLVVMNYQYRPLVCRSLGICHLATQKSSGAILLITQNLVR